MSHIPGVSDALNAPSRLPDGVRGHAPSAERTLGIDVGGTNIKWVLIDSERVVLRSGSFATPRDGEHAVVDSLAVLCKTLTSESVAPSWVGLAIPGHVDRATQATRIVPNVPGNWNGFALGAEFTDRTGVGVTVLNDARAFAIAELSAGAAQGSTEAIFVTVGTGIGGAVALDGRVLRGSTDAVGEVGHITVQRGGPLCGCGNRGCAEAFAGGAALVRRAQDAGLPTVREPNDLKRAAQGGNVTARRLIADALWALGSAVTSACSFLGVQTVVVGGGLGRLWPEFRAEIERQLADRLPLIGPSRVLTAAFGDEGGAFGAALTAQEHVGITTFTHNATKRKTTP